MTVSWIRDVAERVFWTAAEAGLGVLVVVVADIPAWWAIAIGAAAAAAKGWVAKHIAGGASPAALPLPGLK